MIWTGLVCTVMGLLVPPVDSGHEWEILILGGPIIFLLGLALAAFWYFVFWIR
jgi:hypothetical protein